MDTEQKTGEQTPIPPATAAHPELQALLDYVRTRGLNLLLPVGIAVVVVLGVFLYRHQTQSKLNRAAHLLNSVRTVNDLQDIINKYPKTPSAQLAMLMLAKAYYDSGNYGLADSTYAQFEAKYPAHSMALTAKLGRVHVLEAVGQTEQALAAFTDFAKQHAAHYLAPLALFGKARCLEQLGRAGEARAIYEDFIAVNPESAWVPEAESAIANLERLYEMGTEKPAPAPVSVPPAATNTSG
jgi:tetratricopeptide (TPR) repeat protein